MANDYGYFGSGITGYVHYKQAFDRNFGGGSSGGGGRRPSRRNNRKNNRIIDFVSDKFIGEAIFITGIVVVAIIIILIA